MSKKREQCMAVYINKCMVFVSCYFEHDVQRQKFNETVIHPYLAFNF
jgi:hypothetical protein